MRTSEKVAAKLNGAPLNEKPQRKHIVALPLIPSDVGKIHSFSYYLFK